MAKPATPKAVTTKAEDDNELFPAPYNTMPHPKWLDRTISRYFPDIPPDVRRNLQDAARADIQDALGVKVLSRKRPA